MQHTTAPNERRFSIGGKPLLRSNRSGSSPGTVVGRAVSYNSRSEKIGGQFYEEVLPGALDASLSDQRIRALLEHNGQSTLGKVSSGTLRIMPRSTGIDVEIDLPNTTAGRDAAELVSRGDIDGMSFGFTDGQWDWDSTPDGTDIGYLKRARLIEVTLTANPAYSDTAAVLSSGASGRSRSRSNTGAGASTQDREARLQEAERFVRGVTSDERSRRLQLAEAELELLGVNYTPQLEPAIEDRCAKHSSVLLMPETGQKRRQRWLAHSRNLIAASSIPIGGLAARFDVPVVKGDRVVVLTRNALEHSLKRVSSGLHTVELRARHDASAPIASTEDGTLRLWTTQEGLMFGAYVNRSTTPPDLYNIFQRYERTGASVAWTTERSAEQTRYFDTLGYRSCHEVRQASLEDVCITLNPADKACVAYRTTRFTKGTNDGY